MSKQSTELPLKKPTTIIRILKTPEKQSIKQEEEAEDTMKMEIDFEESRVEFHRGQVFPNYKEFQGGDSINSQKLSQKYLENCPKHTVDSGPFHYCQDCPFRLHMNSPPDSTWKGPLSTVYSGQFFEYY